MKSPYSEFITDECSGQRVPNSKHQAYLEGYVACQKEVLDLMAQLNSLTEAMKKELAKK